MGMFQMVCRSLQPGLLGCNAVVRAWDQEPDGVTLNAAVSSCARCQKWVEAAQILQGMWSIQQGPDGITCGAAMLACKAAQSMAPMLELLADARLARVVGCEACYD